jgi:hypothetical protein
LGVVFAIVVAGCTASADVDADELRVVVERDAVVFDGTTIPDEVLTRLADSRVVLLGETHHLREHWELTVDLLRELHASGFRQFLVELPQMDDWLIDDYVRNRELGTTWEPPPFFDQRFTAVRELNKTLPPDDQVSVRSIDANEESYGGAQNFRDLLAMLADHLPSPGPIKSFLDTGYVGAPQETQIEIIESFVASLEADQPTLVETWGNEWYERVAEMLEMELASIDVRFERADDDEAGTRSREEVIKQLVDRRVAECSCGTVINIGGHHAQKSHLMGTEQEWMGDYLAHESPVVDGSIIVIGFTSAETKLEPGAGGTPWNVLESSPEEELLRIVAEAFPAQTVFLPLDDPLFADQTVAYNSEAVIYTTRLKEQFDAIIQYGLASRMPVD